MLYCMIKLKCCIVWSNWSVTSNYKITDCGSSNVCTSLWQLNVFTYYNVSFKECVIAQMSRNVYKWTSRAVLLPWYCLECLEILKSFIIVSKSVYNSVCKFKHIALISFSWASVNCVNINHVWLFCVYEDIHFNPLD